MGCATHEDVTHTISALGELSLWLISGDHRAIYSVCLFLGASLYRTFHIMRFRICICLHGLQNHFRDRLICSVAVLRMIHEANWSPVTVRNTRVHSVHARLLIEPRAGPLCVLYLPQLSLLSVPVTLEQFSRVRPDPSQAPISKISYSVFTYLETLALESPSTVRPSNEDDLWIPKPPSLVLLRSRSVVLP
jgi:hypothetical protein